MKKYALITILFCLNLTLLGQQKKYFLEITFYDGDFKGTHIFYPEKGNYMSQINLGYFEGVSKLNASKLVTDNGMQIHYINRHFKGEATLGKHNAKKYTSGCGSFNFIDLKNNQPYKKIDGDFSGCTSTTITKVNNWKKGIVKNKRTVSGNFTDTVTFKYRMDDGSKKTINTKVSVKFKAQESRRF